MVGCEYGECDGLVFEKRLSGVCSQNRENSTFLSIFHDYIDKNVKMAILGVYGKDIRRFQ